MAEKVTFASVIKNRGFRYLWFNQVLVQMAYNALNFALIVWVFKLTNSNFAVSGVLLAIYLPVILFGIFAGVFVDMADRRRIIQVVDLLLILSFLLFIPMKFSYPLILLNTFIVNSLAQFFMPSESSSIPKLVTKKQLLLANSLFSLTLYGSFMAGFSISGPLLTSFGLNSVFILGAASLMAAFFMARNLPPIITSSRSNLARYFSSVSLKEMLRLTAAETKETFGFIRGKLQVTVSIGLLAASQGVIGVLAAMMPAYLERVLRIHATDASYFLIIPLGMGMVVGAILIGRIFHNWPRRSIVIPAVVCGGLLFILIGVVPTLAQILQSADLPTHIPRLRYFSHVPSLSSLFALIAFLFGLCTVAIIIPSQTVLQESTSEKNRGKIFATLAVIMTTFSAPPVLLAGVLSDLFGVTPIIISLGAIVFLLGLAAMRPNLFFGEARLPYRVKEFLGLGHWEKGDGYKKSPTY